LSDRAQDWEADIINALRGQPVRREIVAERETPAGRTLHMAHPITVHDQACLLCHSDPYDAPLALTRSYGSVNGFGWKMDETVGAQVLSVPMDVPLQRAREALITFMLLLVAVFAVIVLVLNALLHYVVLRPVRRVAAMANAVSLGGTDVETYIKPGKDEISSLSVSFDRMRQSLDHAMQMLKP
jgi:protein-histidine pros-kinase